MNRKILEEGHLRVTYYPYEKGFTEGWNKAIEEVKEILESELCCNCNENLRLMCLKADYKCGECVYDGVVCVGDIVYRIFTELKRIEKKQGGGKA